MADKRFEIEPPEEGLDGFGWQETGAPRRGREALVMELIRRDQLPET